MPLSGRHHVTPANYCMPSGAWQGPVNLGRDPLQVPPCKPNMLACCPGESEVSLGGHIYGPDRQLCTRPAPELFAGPARWGRRGASLPWPLSHVIASPATLALRPALPPALLAGQKVPSLPADSTWTVSASGCAIIR